MGCEWHTQPVQIACAMTLEALYANISLKAEIAMPNLTALRVSSASRGTVAVNLVEVYRSLGGGWQVRSSRRAEELIPEATRTEMLQRIKYWDGILEAPSD